MGPFTNGPLVKGVAYAVAAIIIGLNIKLLVSMV
jgi:Mn2+/Fe2+ NRAMP family transporter